MRVLGIDYGSKRVGIALGDTESRVASPWGTLPNEGGLALLAKIHEIVTRDMVEALVIGVPRPFKDSAHANAQVREIRTFIEELKGLGLPVSEQDEALSSRMAARQVEDANPMERGHKRGAGTLQKRDDLAAANILQTWLDKK